VYNLALQYVQNTADAEEITQDVFLSVHQSIERFQQNAKLSTWLYRITINKSLDYIKAKKRKKRLGIFSSLFFEDTGAIKHDIKSFDHPGVIMENKESVAVIFEHINDLPENQKTALILNKIEHKSLAEIGEIMELSSKAAESLIQRAKATLLKKMKQTEGNR
jgi:RNA polymerase sigma-70 factor (ECF subfamily)